MNNRPHGVGGRKDGWSEDGGESCCKEWFGFLGSTKLSVQPTTRGVT